MFTVAKPRVPMTACLVGPFTRPAENWQHRLLRLTPTRHRATSGSLKVRIETRWRGNNADQPKQTTTKAKTL